MEEKVMNVRGSRNNMRGAVGNKGGRNDANAVLMYQILRKKIKFI